MELNFMTEASARQVAALEQLCFTDPWSEKSVLGELNNPWAIWLTAMDGERLAGYLGIQYGPDGADIMNIAVDPAYRRQGIAVRLLDAMTALLKEKKLQWITLEVRESNAPAIALYTGYGFREVGRRPRYYRRPVEAAILMTKYFEEGSGC